MKAQAVAVVVALVLLAAVALEALDSNSLPAPVECGATITTDTIMTANIGPCPGNGLVVGHDDIILDCAGHTIGMFDADIIYGDTFHGTGWTGVSLEGRSDVTVENCKIAGFYYGFALSNSSGSTLAGNTVDGAWRGFYLSNSSGNTLTGNTANGTYQGFFLSNSSRNALSGNTADRNTYEGFALAGSSGNTLSGNTANGNGNYRYGYGFVLTSSSNDNALAGNSAKGNVEYGYCDETTGSSTGGTANFYSGDESFANGIGGSFPSGLGTPQF